MHFVYHLSDDMSGDGRALQLLMLLVLALAHQVLQVRDLVHADLLIIHESLSASFLACSPLFLLEQLLFVGAHFARIEFAAA